MELRFLIQFHLFKSDSDQPIIGCGEHHMGQKQKVKKSDQTNPKFGTHFENCKKKKAGKFVAQRSPLECTEQALTKKNEQGLNNYMMKFQISLLLVYSIIFLRNQTELEQPQ